jgi:hypothetical protein
VASMGVRWTLSPRKSFFLAVVVHIPNQHGAPSTQLLCGTDTYTDAWRPGRPWPGCGRQTPDGPLSLRRAAWTPLTSLSAASRQASRLHLPAWPVSPCSWSFFIHTWATHLSTGAAVQTFSRASTPFLTFFEARSWKSIFQYFYI